LRFQATGREGYEAVVKEDAGLKYFREFGVLCLNGHDHWAAATGDCEALLHVIEGVCDLATPETSYPALGGRDTPFAGRPAAAYLPPNTSYTVGARGGRVEVTITLAAAAAGGRPAAVLPADVSPKPVGRSNWQRTVTLIAPPEFPAQRLILGETLNPPGNWSGVPAHKHDSFRPGEESVHEELYYFRMDRAGGWGIERIYDRQGLDELILVQDRVVTLMPRGYHTVSAAPGFGLYYSFALSGPVKTLIPALDQYQAWLAS
jgi:5-deoxy-glucuronate isomerase